MLCRDLRYVFSGISEGLGRGSAVCEGRECSAARPRRRVKNKINLFLRVYLANTSNERICTSELDIPGLSQGCRGVLRVAKVYPSCTCRRCDVGWLSSPASDRCAGSPREADDLQMGVCALSP